MYVQDTVLQVNLLWEVHVAGDGGEHQAFLSPVRKRKLNLTVQSSWAQQSWIQRVSPVGGHDNLSLKKRTETECQQ